MTPRPSNLWDQPISASQLNTSRISSVGTQTIAGLASKQCSSSKDSKGMLFGTASLLLLALPWQFYHPFFKKPPHLHLSLSRQAPSAKALFTLYSSLHLPDSPCKDHQFFRNSNYKCCFGTKGFLVHGRWLVGLFFFSYCFSVLCKHDWFLEEHLMEGVLKLNAAARKEKQLQELAVIKPCDIRSSHFFLLENRYLTSQRFAKILS